MCFVINMCMIWLLLTLIFSAVCVETIRFVLQTVWEVGLEIGMKFFQSKPRKCVILREGVVIRFLRSQGWDLIDPQFIVPWSWTAWLYSANCHIICQCCDLFCTQYTKLSLRKCIWWSRLRFELMASPVPVGCYCVSRDRKSGKKGKKMHHWQRVKQKCCLAKWAAATLLYSAAPRYVRPIAFPVACRSTSPSPLWCSRWHFITGLSCIGPCSRRGGVWGMEVSPTRSYLGVTWIAVIVSRVGVLCPVE